MSLNIKNPQTHQLVRQLAEVTGLSQTAAVEDAVRRRLEELANASSQTRLGRLERARAIAAAYRADLTAEDAQRIQTADDWLYDEDGLPA